MKGNKPESNIVEEYAEFLNAPAVNPPDELSQNVLKHVKCQLNPNGWMVFSKLSFLHFLGGLLTLSFCPQFGVNLFGSGYGVTKYFFKLGPYGCTVVCGAIFMGVTATLASAFLTSGEISKIKKYWPLQLMAIALLSLGSFIMLDAEILLSFGAAWIGGGMIGSHTMLETGIFLKKNLSAI